MNSDSATFRHQVRVAAVQVTGLTPDELSTALAYEVEALSGIPAAEAELSWTPVADPNPEVRVYDVVVRRKAGEAGGGVARRLVRPLLWAAALVAVAAAADFAWTFLRVRSAEREIAVRAPLDAQVREIERKAKANRDEAGRIRAARAARAAAHDRVAGLRAAHPALMDALARACGGRMVVRGLSPTGPFAVEMRAAAVTAQDCAESLSALTRAAESAGWRAEPGDIRSSGGGMAEFSCRFAFGAAGKDGR